MVGIARAELPKSTPAIARQDLTSDADTLFAIGMGVMLLSPLLLALCVAWHRHSQYLMAHAALLPTQSANSAARDELAPMCRRSRSGKCYSSVRSRNPEDEEADGKVCSNTSSSIQSPIHPSSTTAKELTRKMRQHGSSALRFEHQLTKVHFKQVHWNNQHHFTTCKVAMQKSHSLKV